MANRLVIIEDPVWKKYLKEYYEIVDEARPLSGFFPTHAGNAFLIMKLSNPASFEAIRAQLLHNRRLKYKLLTFNILFFTFLLVFFLSHFAQVLYCFDM